MNTERIDPPNTRRESREEPTAAIAKYIEEWKSVRNEDYDSERRVEFFARGRRLFRIIIRPLLVRESFVSYTNEPLDVTNEKLREFADDPSEDEAKEYIRRIRGRERFMESVRIILQIFGEDLKGTKILAIGAGGSRRAEPGYIHWNSGEPIDARILARAGADIVAIDAAGDLDPQFEEERWGLKAVSGTTEEAASLIDDESVDLILATKCPGKQLKEMLPPIASKIKKGGMILLVEPDISSQEVVDELNKLMKGLGFSSDLEWSNSPKAAGKEAHLIKD